MYAAMNCDGCAGARLSTDWPLAGSLTNQIAGVVVFAVTTKSFGAALEMVGTATTYWACCSAGTLATNSQVPGGNAEAIPAAREPGAVA